MNSFFFPADTAVAVKIDKLVTFTDKRPLSERMSSRAVRCASVLEQGGFIGWQMFVPVKGLAQLSLFGSDALCEDDLKWILEKTGKTGKIGKTGKTSGHREIDKSLNELYEIYLPVAESSGAAPSIGFGSSATASPKDGFSKWPGYFSSQFEELLRVLRITGGALRVVIGPASEEEQLLCRKNTIRTYDLHGTSPKEYIGRPVKMRVLLRLPAEPSVRLRTVIEESVQGVKMRRVGTMGDSLTARMWECPLDDSRPLGLRCDEKASTASQPLGSGTKKALSAASRPLGLRTAPILPDYAARILMMEPQVREGVTGIEVCEEEMVKIPAGHKNTKDKKAVVIGKALDTTGIRRKITIGEMDLRRHYQIVGQTGTGKSTLLTTLILSAIEKGHGLTFFDPHGSTIDVVLRSLPEKYADRVRVVRIGDIENPVPMNIWDSDDPALEERTISDLCELFGNIYNPPGEIYVGPRWERWFSTFAKASIAFLGRRASLESITVISQSQDNMLKVSKAIFGKYPELVETIKQEYGLDRSNDWNSTLAWFLCKFQRLTSVEQLRRTLGAGANALDFGHTIDTDTVTLIDLASPVIGTHAARIIGTLIMMKLWNAATARKERDRTHLVIVDEASLFQTNPMPKMLAESRKFGIAMVLCHQHTGQLTSEIRDALEANSANLSAFRLSPKDATAAAVRFDNPAMQVLLTRLDAFNAITTLSVDGKQTAPFTLETSRPKKQKDGEEVARRIEERSIETLVEPYRHLRALTAAEILDRLNHPEKRDDREQAPKQAPKQTPSWLEEWKRRKEELKGAAS